MDSSGRNLVVYFIHRGARRDAGGGDRVGSTSRARRSSRARLVARLGNRISAALIFLRRLRPSAGDGPTRRVGLSTSYLMYWESHLNPSPYPIRRTTEHMNTSMGRMLRDSRCTFPLPVV